MSDTRQPWDSYFAGIAQQVSTRATCTRRAVGAVIVKHRRIMATGYNGSPPEYAHCLDGACPRAQSDTPPGQGYDECIAIHAEANALLQCGPEDTQGATLYVTAPPCFGCAKLLAGARLAEVRWSGSMYDGWIPVSCFMAECGIRVRRALHSVDVVCTF